MKRAIAILLGLALFAGAGLAQARGGGGGHGGGGHAGGGHAGGGAGGRPAMGGGHTGGQQFTTGPMRFTTGTMQFTGVHGGRPIVRPPIAGRPPIGVRPGFPPRRVIVGGGGVIVAAPAFWYPPYPYPYPYPYAYETPAYGGPAYSTATTPTYIEQAEIRYYCPDYQDYYPNVPTCPSPWMQVLPDAPATTN